MIYISLENEVSCKNDIYVVANDCERERFFVW